MLEKLVKEINKLNHLVQLYQKEKQWALLDRTLNSLNVTVHMAITQFDSDTEEGKLEMSENG